MVQKIKLSIAEKVFTAAKNEVNDELLENYKKKYKQKLKALADAQKIVRNIEREIDDLEIQIHEDMS